MKSNYIIILTFIFASVVILSCNSSKNIQGNAVNTISKISLEKVTMGSNSSLEITKDEILFTETQRDGSADAAKGDTSPKNWNEINKLISQLDLSQIHQWEGPSQARFYDGARATTIIIEANGEIYNSQSFDEGEPPAELKKLYDYLESLENQ